MLPIAKFCLSPCQAHSLGKCAQKFVLRTPKINFKIKFLEIKKNKYATRSSSCKVAANRLDVIKHKHWNKGRKDETF
jgi:hypothetical protein